MTGHRKAPGQTGLELGMKESYKEDLAKHFGLKLYADGRTRIPSHLAQNDPQIRKIGAARNQRRTNGDTSLRRRMSCIETQIA